ncbi:death domain-containing protein [Endozoicomonas sp. 4G]|uniref:death domain-containing protein n=1 Tax=Endozoicomonas sp. 4G TaxID=2872754 RepID=UPI0020786A81|nr:death domain-containing protein [Endozoicomonas sp. 4G]
MKATRLLTIGQLFFLFISFVTLPLAGHCAAYSSLVSWAGWEKQAVNNGSDHSGDSSRFSGPFAIPGASGTADNGEPFISSGGGSFGSNDDLDDLLKKRPGSGMRPLYFFEWMSELFSSVILLPGPDGQTVKKQIWDTRIVLTIKQGWNEQTVIISQELWNKISAANLERNSGFFLALSRNPDNPEAVFDHYLNSNPPQPLQTEDYGHYAQQEFILSPKPLRSVSVFPGQVPTGIGHPGGTGTGQAGSQKGDLNKASPTQFQGGSGRQNQGSGSGRESGRESGGDDGSGGSANSGFCQVCKIKTVVAHNKCGECLDRESRLLERESTEKLVSEILQDTKDELGIQEADASPIGVFEWFKTLDSNERQGGDYFRINSYYNFPALYNLLTQSFISDKHALSEFYPKWFKFLNGSISLHHLISEVAELAKSQGIEDYVEVTRIVKTLAIQRDEFESETGLKKFRNEFLNQLTSNELLVSDDLGHVFYSGLDHQQKVKLMNYICQIFEEVRKSLGSEIFPSKFLTIQMLNKFARDVYDRYGFGIPHPYNKNGDLTKIIKFGAHGEYSFITEHNRPYITKGPGQQTFHDLGLNISANQFIDYDDVEIMLIAFVLIRSMHGKRLSDMFNENVRFAKDVSSDQFELLRTFTLKTGEQLVKFLENKGAEEKDKFIHSMFLIFGMVPKELFGEPSDQLYHELSDPEPVQAEAYVSFEPEQAFPYASSEPLSYGPEPYGPLSEPVQPAAYMQPYQPAPYMPPLCQELQISIPEPGTLSPDVEEMLGVCSKLGINTDGILKRKRKTELDSAVAQEELLNVASKLGNDWRKFAKHTGVLREEHIKEIDKAGDDNAKARAMMEKWQKMKFKITFNELLEVFAQIGRHDLLTDISDRYL